MQGLLNISNQVLSTFDADAQPQKAIGNPDLTARLGRQMGM
jgi:hypothetical protein